MLKRKHNHMLRIPRSEGFSLIEVAVATVIIGLGVTALLMSVGAGTQINDNAQELTQASFLAGEVREWATNQTFANLSALANPTTFSPPQDGSGNVITDMAGWSQTVSITWRDGANLNNNVTAGTSKFINLQVQVFRGSRLMLATTALVVNRS
jgi:prepilin-type N-terminal cleavage/methylation domain-containing protein